MYRRFTEYLNTSGMAALLQKHGAVLIAYSGGADSTLLLHFLYRYCQEQDLHLYAAHVHHGIRGEEADRDEAHCRSTAEILGIPIYTFHINVPALAKERSVGLEECARTERYACLESLCRTLGNPDMPVATAHNADDQLETVLFHMLRGSGLSGMTGIAPIRENRYLRPLLPFGSAEIRTACQAYGYSYMEDSTNTDTAYTRNYIRHEILPGLRHLTPHPEKAVTRMTELLARDSDCLESEAAAVLANTGYRGRDDSIPREILRQIHPAVGTRILRKAYEEWNPTGSMTAEQTEELLNLILQPDRKQRAMSLPGGIIAEISADAIRFTENGDAVDPSEEDMCRETVLPYIPHGERIILDWMGRKILLSRENLPGYPENLENIYNLSIQHLIDFAKIKGVLCLRTRKAGDTIRYRGIRRKIRKLQNEFHTPPEKRESMLLLADAEEVLWVEGWDACDKVRAGTGGEDMLWIGIYTPEPEPHRRDNWENDKNDLNFTEADHGTEDRPG